MTDLPNLVILDVGHGNCSVLIDAQGVTVFDGGLGDTLSEFLEANDIREIKSVLISHAHEDHIAGLLTVLLDEKVDVRQVYLNPDPRRTKIWKELRSAVKYAKEKKGTVTNTQLNDSLTGKLNHGNVHIEILAPMPENTMSGVGGQDMSDRQITAHCLSVVIRLTHENIPIALLSGDLNYLGMENMITSKVDPKALILVFPHHGGESESQNVSVFTKRLCEAVKPQVVIFSIGRGRHGTPQPVVTQMIRETLPEARILCTQLSEHCAVELPITQSNHLTSLPANGAYSNSCCAGSIVVYISKDEIGISPDENNHRAFIEKAAPTPLCLTT